MGSKVMTLLRENIMDLIRALKEIEEDLDDIFEILKSKLIHDLTLSQFADIYAQNFSIWVCL